MNHKRSSTKICTAFEDIVEAGQSVWRFSKTAVSCILPKGFVHTPGVIGLKGSIRMGDLLPSFQGPRWFWMRVLNERPSITWSAYRTKSKSSTPSTEFESTTCLSGT
jgi:hypothetical protein